MSGEALIARDHTSTRRSRSGFLLVSAPPSHHVALSRRIRSMRPARIPPVNSLEHVSKLRRRDRDRAVRRRRPHKFPALQPLGVKRYAKPIVPKNLDQIAAAPTE